ncbi:MAG: hypothetical protein EOP49_10945 [Sphingobacteriales bacterium]|nr:MAG: hypothetical protein EOP49_10945 [Sphingobacteriales bacterium]
MNTFNCIRSLMLMSALAVISSCNSTSNDDASHADSTSTAATTPQAGVSLADFSSSPDFPDARLSLGDVKAAAAGDSVKLSFNFNVSGYELKHQTDDAAGKQCNNSDKGQHIHFILDNRPYVALYEPKHEVTVAKNTEHYLLCFLSRSYHESLKGKGASMLYHFKVDEAGKLVKMDDPQTPMVFYSRPKGDYLGKDTKNVLFDFYVWNGTLGNNLKVKADVSAGGHDTSMLISEWKPYVLNNLPMGKNSIKLTLVDSAGNKVNGPETEVTREFTLAADEPMK